MNAEQRAFEAEVRRRLAERAGVARDARGEVRAALRAALAEIDAMLAEQPADWKTWHLSRMRAQVVAALGKGSEAAAAAVQRALERAAQLGAEFTGATLAAAGVAGMAELGATVPLLTDDLVQQLGRFCRLRLMDVGEEAAAAIGTQLTDVVLGSKTPFEGLREIHRLLGDSSRAMMRAERILNTEVARAFASAQQAGMERAAESVPGLKKQWRRSGKLHSRAEHDFMDGKVVDVDEKFSVPLKGQPNTPMLYPHDPAAPAAQVINCGCTCIPWMEEWQVMHPGRKPFGKLEKETDPRKARADSRHPPAPGGEVPLPSLARAVVPEGKFGYLFHGHDVGQHKQRVFTSALGFTKDTADEFFRRLRASVAAADKAHLGNFDRYGQRYWLDTEIEGINGEKMMVRSSWIVHEPGGAPELISAMPSRKRKKGTT